MRDLGGMRMTTGYVLKIQRLYGPTIVRVAAKHNLREIAAEIGADGHIDPARIADNFTLRGSTTSNGVVEMEKSLMDAAGVVKLRKTSVRALELLFTLPAQTTIDPRAYFEQATSWAERHFSVPVLSSIVHLDEGAPHAHVLLLPLVEGRMNGSDLHGGKAKLWAMQKSFSEEVGAQYGIASQLPQKRRSSSVREAAMCIARDCLQVNSALNDTVIDALLKPHAKDPEALLLVLGLSMPVQAPKGKTFASIMTAPCKPEPLNPIGKANRNHIGKSVSSWAEKSQPYTCVGIAFPTASFSPTIEPQSITELHNIDHQQPACRTPANATASGSIDANSIGTKGMHQRAANSADEVREASKVLTDSKPAGNGKTRPTHARADATTSAEPVFAQRQQAPAENATRGPPDDAGSIDEAGYTRQRDDDQQAEYWDESRGEFIRPATKISCKSAIIASVYVALQSAEMFGEAAARSMQC